jgi:hypothetical protein
VIKEPATKPDDAIRIQPYYNVDGLQNAGMWFPVDLFGRVQPAHRRGTHLRTMVLPRTFLDEQASGFPKEASLSPPTSMPTWPPTRRPGTILEWELERRRGVLQHAERPAQVAYQATNGAESCLSGFSAMTWCTHLARTTSPPFGLDDELHGRSVEWISPSSPCFWVAGVQNLRDHDRPARARCSGS